MKITKKHLKRLIKEEFSTMLGEEDEDLGRVTIDGVDAGPGMKITGRTEDENAANARAKAELQLTNPLFRSLITKEQYADITAAYPDIEHAPITDFYESSSPLFAKEDPGAAEMEDIAATAVGPTSADIATPPPRKPMPATDIAADEPLDE